MSNFIPGDLGGYFDAVPEDPFENESPLTVIDGLVEPPSTGAPPRPTSDTLDPGGASDPSSGDGGQGPNNQGQGPGNQSSSGTTEDSKTPWWVWVGGFLLARKLLK